MRRMACPRNSVLRSWSSERTDQKNSWLCRSVKFLPSMLTSRSAPPATASRIDPATDERTLRSTQRKSYFRLYQLKQTGSSSKEDCGSNKPPKRRARPMQAAMQRPPSAGATAAAAAQVELRTDAFQATLLWERIVSHLERDVKPGRHSYGLRSYENCFTGHKAVESLMSYLNSVIPRTVKKSQARVLGQKLLLTGVVVDVRKKDKTVFRDNRLYRFTGHHFWDPPRESPGSHGHRCSMGQDRTEGGVYRSLSIENVHGYGASSGREQKRKSSGRGKGYTSDSTLASSSLSKRVVQVKSSRGKGSQRLSSEKYNGRSQLSCSLAVTSTSSPPSASAHPYQPRSSQRSKAPWLHSDSGVSRDIRMKRRTSTIDEEPSLSKTVSNSVGSELPSEVEPELNTQEGQEPTVGAKLSAASSVESKDSVMRSRDALHSQRQEIRQRMLPTMSTASKHCSHSFSDSASSCCSTEQGKGWVVYGYV